MDTSTELQSYRIPGGVCVEDLDGGTLTVRLGEQSTVIPIIKGVRAVEEAWDRASRQDGATLWSQIDSVKGAIKSVCGLECDDDLADALKHRLQVAFGKKKAAQRSDFKSIATSPSSTDSGQED